ncbi:MAG: tryptophan--tRNA ligase [Chloroflexi bacterium]|nr:MAG: tryptophan--tRNA ligase [Chloroflexota bacterium]TMF20759.1 MAG: tryptophan--tRNA ligase [Chloroflexota bacterium]TMF31102.1 MAG: tryptophan--tRNA ligase [Chloroflexota bacterium]
MAQTKRSLSGIRVTGRFHLGNYLGAGINYVRLQDEYESYIFVADYHTLTTKPNAHDFTDDLYDMVMDLIAIGIDPERTVLYRQSAIPKVAELTLLLAMVTPLSWVQRVPTFKEKVRDQPDNVNLGLFEYPVLQCADIVIVKGDVVPVGRDQAAHLELTREITRRFNRTYGEVFPEPQIVLNPDAPLVKGTDGKAKMSKSLKNIVGVTDEPEVIRKQVHSMVTDTKRVYKSQPGHPRSCNVCAFYKFFFDDWEHYWELCRKAEIGCNDKKKLLAERIIERFAPFRERRAGLTREYVDRVLDAGAERAQDVAGRTMVEVRQAVGLPPYRDR